MEIDLTVKYYTKHRYGAGNAKKTKLPMANRKLLRTIHNSNNCNLVTLDGRTSQSCHYCDVETSVKCLNVSQS